MSAHNDNIVAFPASGREQGARRLIPSRLVEARVAQRLNQSELAEAVGVSRQAISSYELGVKSPEPATMRTIAEQLGQPIAFFTRDAPQTFGPPSANFFRKVGPDTKRRNLACEVYANWLAQTAHAFDHLVNYPDPDLPSFEPSPGRNRYTEEQIEEAAEVVRQHFGLGLGPITNVVRLLETRGVIVCRVEIPGENIDAFSFWRGRRPFVFLASDKASAARSRFDAAHELGHLVLHRWVGVEEIEDKAALKEIEAEADRFAGAFLLPRKSFPNEVYSPRLMAFLDLKRRWKVAIQAMIYRCKDLGIFDEHQVTNLYKQVSFKGWRKAEPLDGPNGLPFEQPLLLSKIAELVMSSGRMHPDELQTTLGLSPSWIERLIGIPDGTLSGSVQPDISPTLK
jgi:Zn-dependent peptidase ImmA (M78 family)/transcriptional regulator with XRE-family HTH domain